MLETFAEVERSLTRYADAFQPRTGSVIAARGSATDRFPFHESLLDDLELRAELRARVTLLGGDERTVLARWYCEGADPRMIARGLRRSVRYVYRLRRAAIEEIVELGCGDEFADADVTEFA